MKRKIISVRCQGADLLSLSLLNPLQGDLKELSEARKNKLKNSLIEKGFWFPFFVWKCDQENKIYYIDGHQRDKILPELEAEGYELPEKYPVVFIEAKDKREAIEAILLQTSQYGTMNNEKFYNIIYQNELDLEKMKTLVEIPGLDIEKLNDEIKLPNANQDEPEINENVIITLEMTQAVYFKLKDQINNFEKQGVIINIA